MLPKLLIILGATTLIVTAYINKHVTRLPITTSVTVTEPQAVEEGDSTPTKLFKTHELDLSKNREVYIMGVINGNNTPYIVQRILELGKDPAPINILINSPGGSILHGGTIISAMQAASGPVNTVCLQLCASMAAMIHQYGTHRLAIDRSILMFHPASGGADGEIDKINSQISFIKSYIAEMEGNVAKRSKIEYLEYKKHSGVEWWVSAQKGYELGLVDNIVYVRGSDASKLFPSTTVDSIVSPRSTEGSPDVPNIYKFMWM